MCFLWHYHGGLLITVCSEEVVMSYMRVCYTHLTLSHLSSEFNPIWAPFNVLYNLLSDAFCLLYITRPQRLYLPSTISNVLRDDPDILM